MLLKGLLIGLIFGVPAGAIGALTIQRTLSLGFAAGLATGLGSSAADLLYACVGALGLTAVSDFLLAHQTPICLIGCALLIAMGITIFLRKEQPATKRAEPASAVKCFASSFAVAIANPATILSFLVAFSTFGIAGKMSALDAVGLLLGVALGTGLWWLALAGLVSRLRERATRISWLNRVLGVLLIGFAVAMLIRTL